MNPIGAVFVGSNLASDVVLLDSGHITCTVPPDVGTMKTIYVQSNGQFSAPMTLLRFSRLAAHCDQFLAVDLSFRSYVEPLVTSMTSSGGCAQGNSSLALVNCPRQGGAVITLQGRYFGPPVRLAVSTRFASEILFLLVLANRTRSC